MSNSAKVQSLPQICGNLSRHQPSIASQQQRQPRQLAITQAKAQPLATQGRPTAEEQKNKGDIVTFTRGSNSAAYLLRRLARDAPEVADALERGEFKSARKNESRDDNVNSTFSGNCHP